MQCKLARERSEILDKVVGYILENLQSMDVWTQGLGRFPATREGSLQGCHQRESHGSHTCSASGSSRTRSSTCCANSCSRADGK